MSIVHAAKVRIASALCSEFVGTIIARVLEDRIPYRGCIIGTESSRVTSGMKASIFWRFYESAEARFILRYLPRGVPVIELGASIGVVTTLLARMTAPSTRIVAVEADPELANIARRNVALNGEESRVEVVHSAISYETAPGGMAELCRAGDNISGRLRVDEAPGPEESLRVPATTLSRILDERQIGGYVLVSDIEGAEAELFDREREALGRCAAAVVEFHATKRGGVSVTVDEEIERARQAGFVVLARHGPVCALRGPGAARNEGRMLGAR
jgi:FkbM family methyltransferase